MPSHYDVLGVHINASRNTIRESYTKLVLQYHPDKVPSQQRSSSTAKFRAVQEAWEVLSDPTRRQAYDQKLKIENSRRATTTPSQKQNPSPPPRHEPASSTFPRHYDANAYGEYWYQRAKEAAAVTSLTPDQLYEEAKNFEIKARHATATNFPNTVFGSPYEKLEVVWYRAHARAYRIRAYEKWFSQWTPRSPYQPEEFSSQGRYSNARYRSGPPPTSNAAPSASFPQSTPSSTFEADWSTPMNRDILYQNAKKAAANSPARNQPKKLREEAASFECQAFYAREEFTKVWLEVHAQAWLERADELEGRPIFPTPVVDDGGRWD